MSGAEETVLELVNINKSFGDFVAVDQLNLKIKEGEFFTLVGPSGSGKTTMIRMLVGMDLPTSGEIKLRGEVINEVPANKRPTCMVFQSLALFPHKSVGLNIEFPLKIARVDKTERRRRTDELLDQVQLSRDFYDKPVTQCSGGERQRVALARALAFDPEILFFDEPLSALDFRLRKTLEKALKDLHRETGKTFVYITHSLEEAMVMSDRIGIMDAGKLIQVGAPREIYNTPANRFVAEFMGEINVIEVTRSGKGLVKDKQGNELMVGTMPKDFETGSLVIRPEVIKISKTENAQFNSIEVQLYNEYPLGSRIQYQVRRLDTGEPWLVERLQDEAFDAELGDSAIIGWKPEDSILVQS
ncbi:MAG: spermidine/putrescine transport system ATP-binding protein [Parasphingorhabdus sp.]|jgi:spermidine/putrescine transport system ATP-binding protein